MFGMKALGARAREVLERGGNPYATSLRFLHVVRPRTRRSRRREQAAHMPFESVYLSLDDQVIVEEGGIYGVSYLVPRFLKWGSGPYGLAPGRLVFPAIQQVQFLNRILDTLGGGGRLPTHSGARQPDWGGGPACRRQNRHYPGGRLPPPSAGVGHAGQV